MVGGVAHFGEHGSDRVPLLNDVESGKVSDFDVSDRMASLNSRDSLHGLRASRGTLQRVGGGPRDSLHPPSKVGFFAGC